MLKKNILIFNAKSAINLNLIINNYNLDLYIYLLLM